MLNWLRRRFAILERRWIRDPEERTEHQELVRERMPHPDMAPPTVTDAPPSTDEVDAGRA
ncbi:MAG TPA: hypothetical protein VFQ81_09980 [Candidatus Limnocylindria bacterium]|nr:hypothetical protein [Candidatus Limnocylindria bacterium]